MDSLVLVSQLQPSINGVKVNILAVILLLSASGSATRSMTVDDSIAGIVLQAVTGGVRDVVLPVLRRGTIDGSRGMFGDVRSLHGRQWRELPIREVALRIDGEPRTGWRAWGEAAIRVAAYAADWMEAGNVEYAYRVHIRDYRVSRHTEISDGRVILTTSTGWVETVQINRLTRRIPIHVRIVISARDSGMGVTEITGRATGMADTSEFHCRFVHSRIAEPRAEKELREGLADTLERIEQGGTELYLAGDTGEVIEILRSAVRIGRAVR